MTTSPILLVHICAAVVGLLSGALSMLFRKGSSWHRAAGTVFFVSMLIMSSSATYVAYAKPIRVSVVTGVLTFYLVLTGWFAARRKDGPTVAFDWAAILLGLFSVAAGLVYGLRAAGSPTGKLDHFPAAAFFIFGAVALLFVLSDVRMLVRGELSGGRRIARHLWRMCLALLLTALSFYPGQAKLLPASLRGNPLLYLPALLLIVSMIYWRRRVSNTYKEKKMQVHVNVAAPIRTVLGVLLVFLITAPAAVAQENPLSAHNKHVYSGAKQILLRAAEKMPEENYSFRPTEEVRSYGQILGHVADTQYAFCAVVLGEKNPGLRIEKTKASKADLIAALKDAFTYCDRAYDGLTDASAAGMVKFFGGQDTPKLGVLSVNTVHSIEHYGNLVTYMRMKNVVPPTSEPEFMKQLEKR